MNKSAATFNTGMVFAIFLFGFLALAFFGGLPKMVEIVSFLNKIPAFIYVIVGVIILFMWIKS